MNDLFYLAKLFKLIGLSISICGSIMLVDIKMPMVINDSFKNQNILYI